MPDKILIADDEPDTLDLCTKILKKEGYEEVSTAENGIKAVEMMDKEDFDLLLLDIRMPGKDGMDVLDEAVAVGLDTVMITAYGSIETAVEAMKKGARDYLPKPFTAAELRSVVDKVLSRQKLLKTEVYSKEDEGFCGLVGNTLPMQELYEMIERIAGTDSSIIIEGESGTGKELVAKAIHTKSQRKDGVFIPINCGAIPETLIETELFGHTKGAFTGAVGAKQGLFESASNGTIFLDEINEMPPNLQVKLLRVLQDKEVRPVGDTAFKKVDVRVIAATNKELSKEVSTGRFREDLFYRLSVITLRLPPLRERKEDIQRLAHYFAGIFNRMYNRQIEGFASNAMQELLEYHWPGNVRELENIIERAVILEKGKVISHKSLPTNLKSHTETPSKSYKTLEDVEKEHIEIVLKAAKWNRTDSARMLGIGRRTLYDKITAYGIKVPDEKG